jgi:hypothetical protein
MYINQAIEIAKEFVENQGEVLPGFKYSFNEPKEYLNYFYFDFIFLTLENKIPDEPPIAGGACGFTVNKLNKKIKVLSFGDLAELDIKNREVDELYQQLLDIQSNNKSFNIIKEKYKLSSKDLLLLKKNLKETSLDKKLIFRQLDNLLNND